MELQSKLPAQTAIQTWKASLYEQRPYVDDFRSFQASGGSLEPPLQLIKLPGLPEVEEDILSAVDAGRLEKWHSLVEEAAAALLSPQVNLIRAVALDQPASYSAECTVLCIG